MRQQYALVESDPRGDEEAGHGDVVFHHESSSSPPPHAFSIDGGEEEEEEEEDGGRRRGRYIPEIEEGAIDWNDEIFLVHSSSTGRKFNVACWAFALLFMIVVLGSIALYHEAVSDIIISGVTSVSFQHEEEDENAAAASGKSNGYYYPRQQPLESTEEIIELEDISSSEKTNNENNKNNKKNGWNTNKNREKKNGGGVPSQQRLPAPPSPSHPVEEEITEQPGKGAKKSQQVHDEIVDVNDYQQAGDGDKVDADDASGEANTSNQGGGDDGVVDDDYEDPVEDQAGMDDPVLVIVDDDDDDVSNPPLQVDGVVDDDYKGKDDDHQADIDEHLSVTVNDEDEEDDDNDGSNPPLPVVDVVDDYKGKDDDQADIDEHVSVTVDDANGVSNPPLPVDGVVDDDYKDQNDDQADIDDPGSVTVDDGKGVSNPPLPVDKEPPEKDNGKNKTKGEEETRIGDNHDEEDFEEEEPLVHFRPKELLPPGAKSNGKSCRYTPGVAMEEDPFEIAKGDWPWYPLSMHESSPPPDDPACSCWNNTAACCERAVHPNHKFGHHLLYELFGEHEKNPTENKYNFDGLVNESTANQAGGTRGFRYPPEYFHRPGNVDYREVFVWRNIYEAMVSGYLYHKAGSECWLTGYGKPYKEIRTNKKSVKDSWMLYPAPHVSTEKREICQILVDESEYDGMRVYVEFVIRRYYYTTINIYKAVQLYEDPRHRRTLFVCFDDLNSNDQGTKEAVIRRIIAWMFPGGQHADAPAPEVVEYDGGDATDHEATQRQRLYRIVKRLDDDVFDGSLRNLNEMFGNCGGKI